VPLRTARALTGFVFAAFASAIGCSSSTEPIHTPPPPPPPPQIGHPTGNTATTLALDGYPHGISIASNGSMLITRLLASDVVPGNADELSFAPGVAIAGEPTDVAFTPDGRTAFIPLVFPSVVSIYDVASATFIGQIAVQTRALRALVTPDGNHLYVTTEGNGSAETNVYDFDAHTHALIDTIVVGATANGIAYDSAHARLFVSSQTTDAVFEIDATNDVIVRKIPVHSQPQDVAVSLDGSELWVATESSAGVQVFDAATGDSILSVPNTSLAFGLKMSPDGEQFYVTRTFAGLCAIIDAHTHQVVKPFHTGPSPRRIAFNATGSRAFITDDHVGVVVIE
jgi:DNA-binding beta-propeller fold protein YncE